MPSFIPLRLQSYDKICNQPNFFAFFLHPAPLFSEKELHTPAQTCKMSPKNKGVSPHSQARDSAFTRPRVRTRKAESPHSQNHKQTAGSTMAKTEPKTNGHCEE